MMKWYSGFGINSLANMVAGGYLDSIVGGSAAPTVIAANGPFGEATLSYNSNGTAGYVQKNFGATFSTFYWGQWMRFTAIGSKCDFLCFLDGATPQVYVECDTAGQLSFYRGVPGSGTLLATNAAATLSLNRWTFVEVGIVFNGSTGSVEMKFDGSDVISLTGSLNTAPSGNNHFSNVQIGHLFGFALFISLMFDITNIYACDATGTYNKTFLGPGQVYTGFMTANDTVQFTGTPNAGANTWENISNNPSVGTDYNFSSTATDQDTFAHTAIPSTVSSILAMQLSAFWALDAAGSRTAQLVYKSGATTAKLPASPLSVGAGYSWGVAIEEVDPNTSSPITRTAYNAMTVGYYLAT